MFEVEGFSFGQVVDDILALLILEILHPCTVAGADIVEIGYYGSIHFIGHKASLIENLKQIHTGKVCAW